MSGFSRLALATAVSIWLLVVLGGVVRVTGSGMGCGPDWPLCNGRVVPVFDLPTLIEFGHRLAAGLASLLVVATVLVGLRSQRHDRWVVRSAIAAGLALIVQILLGAVTVLLDLAPTVVALHLGTAAILLGLLTVVATVAVSGRSSVAGGTRDGFRSLTVVTALATFVLILIGSYMMGAGASLGCTELPLCNGGQLLPAGSAGQTHMLHRIAAVVVGLLVAAVVVQSRRRRGHDRPLVLTASLAGGVYVGQFLVGIANVLFFLPAVLRVAHLGLAFALWATLVTLWVLASRHPSPAAERESAGVEHRETAQRVPVLARSGSVARVSGGLTNRNTYPPPSSTSSDFA